MDKHEYDFSEFLDPIVDVALAMDNTKELRESYRALYRVVPFVVISLDAEELHDNIKNIPDDVASAFIYRILILRFNSVDLINTEDCKKRLHKLYRCLDYTWVGLK